MWYFSSLSSFFVSFSTGMEPGEHVAYTGSSKTRETHPGPSHLPGLSLHWIRGHGNQGQLKSHTHPTTLPHHLCCYAGFQTFQAMTTTLLPPLSLSNLMRHFTPRTVLLSKLALAKYSTICEASSIFFNFLVFQKLIIQCIYICL